MDILQKNKQKFWDAIEKYDNFILCLHVNADADSLGSNIAMSELLTQIGKTVTILAGKNKFFSKELHGLGWLQIVSSNGVEDLDFESLGKTCFIMLDTSNEDRLHDMSDKMPLPKIVVDHHASNNIVGAEVSIVDPTFSSASQMVWELSVDCGYFPHTTDFYQAVFMGIYSDTGGFKHGLSARVFEIAESVYQRVDMQPLIDAYNNSVGPDDMLMLAIATNHLEFFAVGSVHFCMAVISQNEMAKYAEINNQSNSNFVVRTLQQQVNVDVLIVANQESEDNWRVRFRSFNNTDHAKKMAQSIFGGGGHSMSASATLVTSNPRTVSAVIKNNAIKIYGK